ncbi:MAG: hypothetical protein JWM87_2623 [Candidatus Eremiobacteraeota bacterium]|nr:hypothetical protein [Candidatus Eremiobacteraeota bacterium]
MQQGGRGYDLREMLTEAFDEFERAFQLRVSFQAREALLRPALEHEEEVLVELQRGQLTPATIRDKAFAQLQVAAEVAERRTRGRLRESAGGGRKSIEQQDAQTSMDEQCEWFFWC